MSPRTLFARAARPALLVLCSLLIGSGLSAQAEGALDRALANLRWREIGPAVMGGRISAIVADEANPAVFYVGTATGGLWKTESHGTSWTPLFDDQPTSSIGAVALARSNPNIVWVGTGEPQNRQSSPWGDGVYKSLDGGRTWQHMGLAETRHIGRIVIDPTNPDVVYVAAVGHLWGPNPERGVFKTTDGGATWSRVLYVDDHTGAIDLVMDPGDPKTLFAAMYQRRRTAWGFNGGGPGSGIYRTYDGGATWTRLRTGLPEGELGRIGLDIYRRDGRLVYAVVEADPPGGGGFGGGGGQAGAGQRQRKGGVFRSTDRGETWEKVNDINPRPMYFSLIRIDPNDPNRIYLGGVELNASDDGGRTWDTDAAEGVHSDHHALWIDPNNSSHLILGSDGGVSVSFDRAKTWRMYDNLPLGQFYEVGVDMRDPYYVCGGLQDNGSWCGPSRTHTTRGITNADWYNIWGGDGFYARIDPNDPTVVFAESQNGNFGRLNLAAWERIGLRPRRPGEPAFGGGDDGARYRWNWNTPLILSAHDPATLYAGAQVVLRSPDRGMTWSEISPDLTKNIDRSKLPIMGRLPDDSMLSRHDGVSFYGTITTISESPLDPRLLYVGTDDGNVQVTRDGGATWTDLTPRIRGVPDRTYVSRVLASAHNEGTVYVTFDGHYADDYRPYVFVSDDYGQSWRAIVNGLPKWSVNVIQQHPRNPDLLFVGNEIGVYVSIDRGQNWVRLKNNLPTVPVDDIVIHPRENDLVLGTHGRSVWIMDDIGALEELTRSVLASELHLFRVRPAVTFNMFSPQGWTPGAYAAPNPEAGAVIRYYLARDGGPAVVAASGRGSNGDGGGARGSGRQGRAGQADESKVTITIADAAGTVVRTLEGPAKAGIQEVVWDLRYEPPFVPENQQGGGGGGGGFGFGGPPRGPRVLPGTYTVRLGAGNQTRTTALEVRGDRRIEITRADLEARQAALMSLYTLAGPLYEALDGMQQLNRQVGEARRLVGRDAPQELRRELAALDSLLRDVGRDLNQERGTQGRLFGAIEGWTARPARSQLAEIDTLWAHVPPLLERYNEIVTSRAPAFFARLYQEGVRPEPQRRVAIPQRP